MYFSGAPGTAPPRRLLRAAQGMGSGGGPNYSVPIGTPRFNNGPGAPFPNRAAYGINPYAPPFNPAPLINLPQHQQQHVALGNTTAAMTANVDWSVYHAQQQRQVSRKSPWSLQLLLLGLKWKKTITARRLLVDILTIRYPWARLRWLQFEPTTYLSFQCDATSAASRPTNDKLNIGSPYCVNE